MIRPRLSRLSRLFSLTSLLLALAAIFGCAEGFAQPLRRANAAERLGWQPGDTLLVIPQWVRSIPDYAFAELTELREVRFEPSSQCRTIGDHAFACCEGLRRVTGMPPRLALIGEGAFRECVSLDSITIPEGILEIPKGCFTRCESLRSVRLSSRLLYIKDFAFTQCTALDSIALPERVETIGMNSFALCTSLRTMHLPASVKSVESYAFAGCTALEEITLPRQPYTLGELILEDCPSLRLIIAPAIAAPPFECDSWLADPQTDPAFYRRVRLEIPERALPSYRRAHCWSLFFP